MTLSPSEYLPEPFRVFVEPVNVLHSCSPAGIAVVGSYGNLFKTPSQYSDFDLIFVFDKTSILDILKQFVDGLAAIDRLEYVYLGVTFQFGHTFSLYFQDQSLQWVDIGIMDSQFARNYLVNLPLRVLHGEVPTCGIPTHPGNQMHHLAKKIVKASYDKDVFRMTVFCYRYLGWLRIHRDTAEMQSKWGRLGAPCQLNDVFVYRGSEFPENAIWDEVEGLETSSVIRAVLSHIERSFPYLLKAASF